MKVPNYREIRARKKESDYAIVIPVLNEGSRLHALLTRMQNLNIYDEFDVVIVDGLSDDNTLDAEVLDKHDLAAVLERVSPGKLGTQLQCAYSWAKKRGYRGVITIDGNNKDNPDKIHEFSALLEAGVDFVQASRFVKGGSHENTPVSRLAAIRLLHAPLLSLSSGFRWTDTTQGFRGYSMKLICDENLDIFRPELSDYKFLFYITHRAPRLGLSCCEIGTQRNYPRGEPVPTKIKGLKGNAKILLDLFAIAFGKFD